MDGLSQHLKWTARLAGAKMGASNEGGTGEMSDWGSQGELGEGRSVNESNDQKMLTGETEHRENDFPDIGMMVAIEKVHLD